MRLAFQLAIRFGLLAASACLLVGATVRYRLVASERERFRVDVQAICERIRNEVVRQADADRTLITGFCEGNELVQQVGISLDTEVYQDRRLGFQTRVENECHAFGVDELLVAIERVGIVGASPLDLLGLPQARVDALIRGDPTGFVLRAEKPPAIVTRCTKASPNGRLVGMVAARHVAPTLERIAKTLGISVFPFPATPAAASASAPPLASATSEIGGGAERTTCRIEDGRNGAFPFVVVKPTRELDANLAEIDRVVGGLAIAVVIVALVIAVFMARGMGRPLEELAQEAGKVATDEARPIRVRGSSEVRALALAFDRMIKDLAVTRRRLAAASRVAAWREVARRVAHEVKNPLAPIRAAVETLRRLRAREDPRFDDYFDEATRTVLDEVHRISNIVTEFTRFARLPQPRPQDVDVDAVVRHVVQMHVAAAGTTRLEHVALRPVPKVRADRDQVVQVLTNLVQNALDAVRETENAAVTLTTDTDGHYVTFAVADNGPGLAPEFAGRLFEPYATTKATGTGLGLAIAQRIAYEHNGELSYAGRGEGGRGAVFRLVLPIEGPPPASEAPPPPSSGSA